MPPAEPVTRRQLRHAQERTAPSRHRATVAPAAEGDAVAPIRRRHVAPAGPQSTLRPAAAPTVVTRRALREADRRAARRSATRLWSPLQHPLPGQGPALGMLVAVAFLLGAVTSVQDANADRADRARAATLAAARDVRHSAYDADGRAPFVGLATEAAALRRAKALDAATTALAAADDAIVQAGGVVGAETIDPLAAAASQLQELVAVAASPSVDVTAVSPTGVSPTAVSPTAASPTATGPAADAAADPAIGAAATPAGPTSTAADPTADPATPPRITAPVPDVLAADAPTPVGTPPAALDVATSDRLLEAAAQVIALADQLRQTALQVAAEQAAEAARVAAEQAAAHALAQKIAAADAAPNGEIPADLLCSVSFDSEVLLRCDAAAALDQLDAAFRAHFGVHLAVTDSYRDYAGQVSARLSKGDLAATPGTSNHGRGLAVDLSGFGSVGQFDRPYYLWMAEHAQEYGWLHPAGMGPGGSGPLEPWHWEFDTE